MTDMGNRHQSGNTDGEEMATVRESVPRLTELALELARDNRWSEAISANEAITKKEPANWQAWTRLGRCRARTGDAAGAIASLRQALAIRESAETHNELGVVLIDAGDGAGAVNAFRNAVRLNPSDAVAHSNLGNALRLTNQREEARQALERALAIDASSADAHGNLGNLLRDLGETEAAIRSLRECIRLQPGRPETYAFLAGALLEAGRSGEALSVLDGALRLDPVSRVALAYKAAALQEVGDLNSARFLLDLDGLIDIKVFTRVPGYDSAGEFNAALAAHVLRHPTLSYERTGNATRFGSHTSNLLEGDSPVAATFSRLVSERVREYFARRAIKPEHPFLAHRMRSWGLVAWGVIMRSGGHQIPHIHPSAWLSGVYYVKVPPSVRIDSDTRDGWIEFGSPPEALNCKRQVIEKFFFPEEGKMILFPSYFYHKTIPLPSGEERISVAFDVAPGGPRRQSP